MHDEQTGRTYYEIIDEVCNRLAEEGPMYDIDRPLIYSIQTEWIKNLENIQNAPYNTEQPIIKEKKEELEFSDNHELGSDYADADSELMYEELENNLENHMLCLFVKVLKTKNKWKCSFKQGFINIDRHDIPFAIANGELEWI